MPPSPDGTSLALVADNRGLVLDTERLTHTRVDTTSPSSGGTGATGGERVLIVSG